MKPPFVAPRWRLFVLCSLAVVGLLVISIPPARSAPADSYTWFNGSIWQQGTLQTTRSKSGHPVLKVDGSDRTLTGQIIVQFRTPVGADDAAAWGTQHGLKFIRVLPGNGDMSLYADSDDMHTLTLSKELTALPEVLAAYPNFQLSYTKRFIPNDPLFSQQWHLRNTGQAGYTAGNDINVITAWDTFTGTGTVVQVVDDGVQIAHPDLAANVNAARCFNYLTGGTDPTPSTSSEAHGTSVAGTAAGVTNNNLGVSGVAFNASLIGLDLLENFTVANEADAMVRNDDIVSASNNSYGPPDGPAPALQPQDPPVFAAQSTAVTQGRGGKGVCIVWAGGNGRLNGQQSNQDGEANSRFAIAVAASDGNGVQSAYSESGANILVNAPSSSFSNPVGLVTTDFTGVGNLANPAGQNNYTSSFGGTSGAAPVVTGAVALILQANPSLTYRDVMWVLAKSSSQNDASNAGWFTNAAGLHFNNKYGFGRVNVGSAIALALTWVNVGPETVATSSAAPNAAIPDGSTTGVSSTINITGAGTVEVVTVTLTAPHDNWPDLQIVLTSPSGTQSVLNEAVNLPTVTPGINGFTFSSRAFLGENAGGNWTLNISDRFSALTGTFNSWQLNVFGTNLSAQPTPSPTPAGSPSPGSSPSPSPTPATSPTPAPTPVPMFFGKTPGGLESHGGGCFIATAAYGTATEAHVVSLRGFRDHVLMQYGVGRWFVSTYYRYSPPIADWIRDRGWARAAVRVGLAPLIFAVENPALAFLLTLLVLSVSVRLWLNRRRQRMATA